MALPTPRGLYDPRAEHDSCGLGFVAETRAPASHEVVERALVILERLAHRGAMGADPESGDGAGILLQIPHAYYERVLARVDEELPLPGDYGVAMCFLSRDGARRTVQMRTLEKVVRYHNQKVVGWRDVPVDPRCLGPVARADMPHVAQLFVARMGPLPTFERTLFMIRKRAGRELTRLGVGSDFYVASFSSKTVVYKGLMLPGRLRAFYTDLAEDDVKSKLALVHSRFSTNTFPTWERAHPYRRIAHNGEINTLRGNQNWMSAREALLASRAFGEHLADMKPIIRPGGSDSASLDNVVDFLIASGRSIAHVMMMLVPEAWVSDPNMDPDVRAFYEYHAALVEPWDGPAALVFTDGDSIGAMLDRNGLRPARWMMTEGGTVVLSSEAGVVDVPAETVVQRGRLSPGRMLLVDTKRGRVIPDEETKRAVSTRQPYAEWLADHKIELSSLPGVTQIHALSSSEARFHRRAFAYSREDLEVILAPMARGGEEPVGSMGADIPLAVLSDRAVPLYRYFKQQFAQVTNPPIDPIREDLVVQLTSFLGGEGNLLEESPSQCRLVELAHPVLTSEDLAKLARAARPAGPVPQSGELVLKVLPALFDARRGAAGFEAALAELVARAEREVDAGASILVVSDRGVDEAHAALPMLLAVSAVHHHLVRAGKRARTGIVAEAGDAREVADVALLIGYGAGAVSPYLALETIADLAR
ncbi:MAG: glutamate synthase subunit alpha, partial [Myxococcales bacterium]|nr:glutamate synthase subunit alpha [Myxococcales bacterium]